MRLTATIVLLSMGLCGVPSVCASEHFSDYERFCSQSEPKQCSRMITKALAEAAPYSAVWYQLKGYQFDFLYDTKDYRALNLQTEPLVARTDYPLVFQAQLYFYHAKSLIEIEQAALAIEYAKKALALLESNYQVFSQPLRMVELANLSFFIGDYRKAEQRLVKAQQQFRKSKDPVFWFELYANFANVHEARQQLQTAARYRELCLQAILPSRDRGKIMLAYGNAARAFQRIGELEKASQYYRQGIAELDPTIHHVYLAKYQVRLAETLLSRNQPQAAREQLLQVSVADIPDSHQPLYQQLQQQLAAVRVAD